ncbi:S8 family peptidase [Hymenobacter sp. BT507]|uniref:S8 family peptidase n=1 Tax=Hymenobacter citatus TaxID=2763506 RepID=A0ABR7MQ47_9BACT|nr:S8 family peptidase [Hymenobacter citatus]MBC6613206.1 S8 family peptidase [Hymenobacter citatus]
MPPFEHLSFLRVVEGTYKYSGKFGKKLAAHTRRNLANPRLHGGALRRRLQTVRADWEAELQRLAEEGFQNEGATAQVVPLFLQVDPKAFDEETLRRWGIEVVSVEPDGYIIGVATSADFPELNQRLNTLLRGKAIGEVAALWDILPRAQSLDRVVSFSLLDRWETIDQETGCWVEVAVAVEATEPEPLAANATPEQEEEWDRLNDEWLEKGYSRISRFEQLVRFYGGEIQGSPLPQSDTINYKLFIPGRGVKELAQFPYTFSVEEWDWEVEADDQSARFVHDYDVEVLAPPPNAPSVCIIDSGMQAGHRLLQPAVDAAAARCYLPGVIATADMVPNGGHGTRVAGAVLFPDGIPASGTVEPVAWLQNARVLNAGKSMEPDMFPAQIMRRIVYDFMPSGTRLFNLSVQTPGPCRLKHMSSWAAELDQLSFENDILFITSAGNIGADGSHPVRLSVAQHLAAGRSYPHYLAEPTSRIGNPAQSMQALTVGSVSYERINTGTHTSFGEFQAPSAFSRSGLGLWDSIKPDVVEYGGDLVQTATGDFVYNIPTALPELVTSTLGGHPAVTRTEPGTSFATPKVTHIAAVLQRVLPNYSTLLYRALIAQSAQWPTALEEQSQAEKLFHLRTLGYGIPDKDRATQNSDARVTFITEDQLSAGSAHLYQVRLNQLAGLDDETLYRLDVTLSYAARPRRTRQGLRNYVSTRLQWQAADLGQDLEEFLGKVDVTLHPDYEDDTTDTGAGTNRIFWQIGSTITSKGSARGVRRQNNTLQKDWAFVKGYELSRDRLLFAVTAHKGWDKSGEQVPYAFTVSITSLAGVPIYETIRVANQIPVTV